MADAATFDRLPAWPPFGMGRETAARHLGIGVSMFDALVASGKLPQPREVTASDHSSRPRKVWLRPELEDALAAFGSDDAWEAA